MQTREYFTRARYPNAHPMPEIPATVFSRTDAEKSVALAEQIFEITEKFCHKFGGFH
jgi:HEPN domain-containing protein